MRAANGLKTSDVTAMVGTTCITVEDTTGRSRYGHTETDTFIAETKFKYVIRDENGRSEAAPFSSLETIRIL